MDSTKQNSRNFFRPKSYALNEVRLYFIQNV
ncbi:hypothetical protein T06_8039 [Trichinella sp. T6]|nr:hypothetical protein T06_8039 [Trichinella sp. T6]